MFGKSSTWSRSLFSILVAPLLVFGSVSPASAVPDVVAEMPSTVETQYTKTLNNGSVFTWGIGVTENQGEGAINGVLVGENGSIFKIQIFDTFSFTESVSVSQAGFTQLSNGTLILAWARYSGTNRTSKLFYSTSFDGITWTTKAQPIADFIPATGKCLAGEQTSPDCGYREIFISQDGLGRVAMAFSTRQTSGLELVMPITLLTSTNLSTWTVAVTHRPKMPVGAETYVAGLIGLNKGGFGITLTSMNQDAEQASTSTGIWLPKAKKFTSVRTTQDRNYRTVFGYARKGSGDKHYQFSYVWANQSIKLGYEVLDAKTRTWSKIKYFNTVFPGMLSDLQMSQPDIFGDVRVVLSMIGFMPGSPFEGDARTYLITIPNGKTPSEPVLVGSSPELSNTYLIGVNSDNNIVLYHNNAQNDVLASVIANNQLGSPQVISNGSGGTRRMVADAIGNPVLAQKSYSDNVSRVTFIRPDIKPLARALPVVSGSAKSNRIVTVSDIQFVSNTTVGNNTFQWYACETAVSRAQFTTIPANCMAIPGANARSYTVTVNEKGQFLAATVSNTNPTGTTQILTKSTGKVK